MGRVGCWPGWLGVGWDGLGLELGLELGLGLWFGLELGLGLSSELGFEVGGLGWSMGEESGWQGLWRMGSNLTVQIGSRVPQLSSASPVDAPKCGKQMKLG